MAIVKRKDIIDVDVVIKDLNRLQKEFDELIKLHKELQKQTRQVNKSGSGAEAKERISLTQKMNKATKDLTLVQKERIKTQNQLQTVLAKNLQANEKNAAVLAKGKVRLQERNRLLKQEAKEALGLVGAYDKLSKELNDTRKSYKNLAAAGKENSKEAKKQLSAITKLDKKLKQIDNSVGQNQRSVGKYTNALKGLGGQLLGAAGIVGGLDAVIGGFKAFGQKAKEMSSLTRKVEQTFKVTNNEAKKLASTISALAKTFGEDYNEIMGAANTVSKEFGITGEKALKLIEEGFKKGSNNSGEFIDILKEYPTQLKSIGLSAKESFAIINQQVTAGVYSDKGIDALKEGGIRLRENTKAVKAALSPLEDSVELEIERKVAAGDTFEAMQLIAKSMKESNLTAEQTQAIMSDVFGGAGEDALSFVQNLDDVKLSLDDVATQTSVVQDSQLLLNEKWSEFVVGVEDGSGFISQAWAKLQDGASNLLEQLINLNSGVNAYTQVQINASGFNETLIKQWEDLTNLIEKGATEQEKSNKALIVRGKLERQLAEQQFKLKRFIELGADEQERNARLQITRLEQLIEKTDNYIVVQKESNIETENETKSVIKLTSAQKKQLEQEKLIAEEKERRKGIQDRLGGDELTGNFEAQVEDALSITEKINKGLEEQAKKEFEIKKANEIARQQEIEDAKLKIKEEAEKAFISFASDLTSDFVDERLQESLDAAEAEKKILEDKLDKGVISQEQFNDELAKINRKQRQEEAKAEKKKALFDIAIATAVAVAKAGFIKPAAFAALAAGAIQAGLVAARPLPKFEKGEVNINGKRHSQGGILAEIEGGESVINREGTSNAPKLLEAINQGLVKDMDMQGLTKSQRDGLTSSLLMKGNKQNEQIIQALSNLGYSFEHNGKIHIFKGNGEVLKKIK